MALIEPAVGQEETEGEIGLSTTVHGATSPQVVVLQMRRTHYCQKQGKILFLESVFFVLGVDSVFAPVLGALLRPPFLPPVARK